MLEKIVFLLLFLSIFNKVSSQRLSCHSCQGGPRTHCAKVISRDVVETCVGRNAQCYEAYVDYQNGAMPMIQRRCWTTPENSTDTNFCRSFRNPVGKLRRCITCRTNLCNTDKNFWIDSQYY